MAVRIEQNIFHVNHCYVMYVESNRLLSFTWAAEDKRSKDQALLKNDPAKILQTFTK